MLYSGYAQLNVPLQTKASYSQSTSNANSILYSLHHSIIYKSTVIIIIIIIIIISSTKVLMVCTWLPEQYFTYSILSFAFCLQVQFPVLKSFSMSATHLILGLAVLIFNPILGLILLKKLNLWLITPKGVISVNWTSATTGRW